MWLYATSYVLTHLAGGELFGPTTWFICNDLLVMGIILFLFPRAGPKTMDADLASDSFVRSSGACFATLGWAIALVVTDDPKRAPFGDFGENILGAQVTPSFIRNVVLVVLAVHLAVTGVLGIRGMRLPELRVRKFSPPYDRGIPQLEEVCLCPVFFCPLVG